MSEQTIGHSSAGSRTRNSRKGRLENMQVLSAKEVAEWFQGFENLEVESDYVHADKDGLFFTHPEAACIDLEYPSKLEQLPFFARFVATIGYEEQLLRWSYDLGSQLGRLELIQRRYRLSYR
jgi:hypothetical protein